MLKTVTKTILAAFMATGFALPAMAQSAVDPAVVGNIAAGAKKNSACIGCHGIPEYKTAFPLVYRVPKIAGQSEKYLVSSLAAYRSGERSHPSMRAISGSLSDQDIADLAAYYANKK
jgi:cytochrome c553